jgi:hypothetical protein
VTLCVLCAVSCDLCDRRKKKEGVKEFSRNVHSRAGDPGSDPQIPFGRETESTNTELST